MEPINIRTDQRNAFAWTLVRESADLYAKWLLACANLRGSKPNAGDVCIRCMVEAINNENHNTPKRKVPNRLKQQSIETCRRAKLQEIRDIDWDGCEVATVAVASGEPMLKVTARAGARFVNAYRPGRELSLP